MSEINQKLRSFFNKYSVPLHQKALVEALNEKREEFKAVKQIKVADIFATKIEKWIVKNTPSEEVEKGKSNTIGEFKVSKEFVKNELIWISWRIRTHAHKIAKIAKQKLAQRVQNLKSKLDHLTYEDFMELVDIRLDLQERMHQSVRALKVQKSFLFNNDKKSDDDGAVVSMYNDTATIKNLFSQLSSSDPIWVADFLQLYGEMFGLDEHLLKYIK